MDDRIKTREKKKVQRLSGERMEGWLNHFSIRKKLMLLYLFCVLLPLIVTDSMIISMVVQAEVSADRSEMSNIGDALQYTIKNRLESAIALSMNIYSNRYINEFMEAEYESPLDYFNRYREFLKDSLYEASVGTSNYQIVMYAQNPGIVNGGRFWNLDSVKELDWFEHFKKANQEILIYPYYEQNVTTQRRKISIIRRMDYYHKGTGTNLMKMDMDYSGMAQSIVSAKYRFLVYICDGDTILFSNDGHGGTGKPFEVMTASMKKKAGLTKSMKLYDRVWDIYIMKKEISILEIIQNNGLLITFLVLINLLLPALLMKGINHSFTNRLHELGMTFEQGKGDELMQLPTVRGTDEIGVLMRSYNRMADRMNDLIQTVYKDKMREQEMDIARQKAELLALHSQINPHFLFNALESIRMHSLIKKEAETAAMVERLALMQRQNVDWGNDSVLLEDEIQFVEAYLELQKYRFGDRLSYRIEIDPFCRSFYVPKLTLVTFVENACVHGMENKAANGWIFVRVYQKEKSEDSEGELRMEIEDTGQGLKPELLFELQSKMREASMELIQENQRIGILNACLRLKMATDHLVQFELESEEGSGTIVTVTIPISRLKRQDETGKAGDDDPSITG